MKTYLQPLEQAFKQAENPEKAAQMKAYMKDQFDFYGITSPERKRLIQHHKVEYGLIPPGEKEAIVQWCWQQPQREWQYFAMEMLGCTVKNEKEHTLDLYEYLVITKSWWDTIDFVASNLVGPYFRNFPHKINPVTSNWMASGNMWLQRTCLLFQLKYKNNLDKQLLESFILPLASSKEFFIRKAIGWILREYSKTDAAYVRSFVSCHKLSGLSHREALKWLDRK